MRRAALVLALLVVAAACARVPVVRAPVAAPPPAPPAARPDLYVLLPGANGSPGALVVTSGGQVQTLDRAFTAAKVERPGAITPVATTEAEVLAIFGAVLSAQPPRPVSFVLFFMLDSDALTPESERIVGDVVSEIARRPVPEVLVIGHTDTMGTGEHNDRLSLQRAQRIRTRLLQRGLGLPPDRVLATGRGERELLVPTADQVAEPRNRRVELVVR
jgi:outer membrane protein OmpA-like peptidoglycan-associated protein